MANTKHEDAILKMGFDYFRGTILKTLGIDYENVITYVIYSGGIKDTVTQMNCGINTYQVIPIYLSDKDADAVLERLHEKKENGDYLQKKILHSLH